MFGLKEMSKSSLIRRKNGQPNCRLYSDKSVPIILISNIATKKRKKGFVKMRDYI